MTKFLSQAMKLYPPAAWRVARVLAGGKAAYWAFFLAALWVAPDFDQLKFEAVNARWPREGGPVFASHFATWDAAHYLRLSEVGYAHEVPSCAFYLLWPLLVRWLSPVFGGSHLVTGLVLSNVLSLAAWGLFHRLVARRWGEGAANWSLVFLVACPGALFFQFNYSESLFLLLVLGLWWGLEARRDGWAWLAACLLPLTRGVGVFAVLPIAWYVLEPVREWVAEIAASGRKEHKGGGGFSVVYAVFRGVWLEVAGAPNSNSARTLGSGSTQTRRTGVRRSGGLAPQTWQSALRESFAGRGWLLTGPLLGWGVYLALMWGWTGDPFEGFKAQKHWGVHSISNLWNVPKFAVALFTPYEWHEFTGSVLDRCVFIMLLNCLPILWRLDKALLVWTYMLGVIPAMSGTFTSYTRFASCAFPMFIALGVVFSRREWRWPRYALLAVFVTLHVVLVWRFVNFRWAG